MQSALYLKNTDFADRRFGNAGADWKTMPETAEMDFAMLSFRVKNSKNTKKNEFFSYKHWNFCILRVILTALFAQICFAVIGEDVRRTAPKPAWQLEKELRLLKVETGKKLADLTNERDRLRSEVEHLQYENSLVRKELIETLEKYSMLADKLKRVEMSAAAVVETLKPEYSDVRADESAESLRTVMQSSVALASAAASLCDAVIELLGKSDVDAVYAARLRVSVNSVKSEIRNVVRYNAVPAAPHGFVSCRILNTDEKLKAVVLSAGYRNGLRVGMVLRTADGKTSFQVVMLKDFTAAGLLLDGSLNAVGVGTELTAAREQTAK